MRTVLEDLEELGDERDFRPISRSGHEGESWMVLDFVDVIVHLFNDESRLFYDLDNLWGDARRLEFQAAEPAPSPAASS